VGEWRGFGGRGGKCGREMGGTSLTTVSRFPLFRGAGEGVLLELESWGLVGLVVECMLSRCLRTS